MRATVRWVRADLRARRGQALLELLVVAGVVTALVLSVTLLEGATDPWRQIFARSRGAHVWVHTLAETDVRALGRIEGVTAVAGPYRTAAATLAQDSGKAPLELRAMSPDPPPVARPLVREGHWLDPRNPEGVVLERSFARAERVGTGDHVVLRGLDGTPHPAVVAGIADTSDQGFYPDWSPGLAWVLPSTLTAVEPVARHTQQAIGLRLADAGAADFAVQRSVTVLGGRVERVSTWRQARSGMELNNRLLGLLLALFGLVGLLAAALAIGNATGGRVLAQLQDIAMLKTIGFTPAQVARMLLLEHAALAMAGIVLGLVGANLLALLLSRLAGSLVSLVGVPLPSGWLVAIAAGAELTAVVATVVPAWQAGRVSPLPAARAALPGGRLSRLARVALLVHLPPALVLGARDAFARPLRATLTIGGLAVPMLMITIGLGCWATLDGFERHPDRVGLAAALVARPGGLGDDQARRLLIDQPDVAAAYPGAEVEALLPGQTRTITTRALGTSARPYPFPVREGRLFHAPGEAVAGQGLLDLLQVRVGERVRLTIDGVPLILHIVGRSIEPEHNGQMLSYGLDTLEQLGGAPKPAFYRLVLRPGADPAAVQADLLAASGGRLDVRPVVNPADQLAIVRVVIPGLVVVLALTGLANLLTAISVGLRDHLRDLGVLRAMGLTPRQVAATIVTSTGLLTLVAVLAGTALGRAVATQVIDMQARTSGVGAGIAQPPAPGTILAAAAIAVAVATLAAVVPAGRAAAARLTPVLRPN
ncbi:MAG TPA: FtsX-like permease family protein [Actinomycetes bacterium]|nr:FtsX-like permease family protein [Actinomycetes bacterium]